MESFPPAATAPPGTPGERTAPNLESQPRIRFGTPEIDQEVFKPRQDVITPDAGAAPHVNLEAARKRASEIVREGSSFRGLVGLPPPATQRESREARAIGNAIKPDCRNAYAGLGLLAIAPLAWSALTDTGCRW